MGKNCKPQSLARRGFNGLPGPFGQGKPADPFSVARVRPRTSKGITDLLLLNFVRLNAACPSKKIYVYAGSKNHTRTWAETQPAGLRDTGKYVYLVG
uniref:Putative secreted protein n=1 Tax=Xenopsylla cheopis TaxID=163159 RepID=A0A6M2DGY1_XENCH